MAKRFTDTDKWKKPWYRKLKPVHKVFWAYILDNCDNAGVWEVDFELAESFVGAKLPEAEIAASFSKQIHIFADGKRWLLLDFIDFQYGVLKPTNNAHRSVISILSRHKLESVHESHRSGNYQNPGASQPLGSPCQGAQDKDKDKDKDKDLLGEEDSTASAAPTLPPKGGRAKPKTLIADDWEPTPETLAWCARHHLPEPDFQRLPFLTYWQGRGEARADWQATFRNWMTSPFRKDRINGPQNGTNGYESAPQRNNRRLREEIGKIAAGIGAPGGHEILPLLPEADSGGRGLGR